MSKIFSTLATIMSLLGIVSEVFCLIVTSDIADKDDSL